VAIGRSRAGAASGIPEFDRLASAFDGMGGGGLSRELKITWLAVYDILTGLANRGVFAEGCAARKLPARHRDGTSFAVLYLDLDHFKGINDTLGSSDWRPTPAVGGRTSAASVRDRKPVCFRRRRICLDRNRSAEPADAATLALKVLNALSEPVTIQNIEVRSGASVGIPCTDRITER